MNDWRCFVSFLVFCGASVLVVCLVRGSSAKKVTYFDGWRDVFKAWDEARNNAHRFLVILMMFAQLIKGGMWGIAVSFVGLLSTGLSGICGFDLPDVIERFGRILRDFENFALRLNNKAPLPPPAP